MGGSIGENLMSDAFDFSFTEEKLSQLINNNPYTSYWFNALSAILPEYEINTKPRVAGFLAQTGHESLNFTALQENLNYSAKGLMRVWPKRFPLAIAAQYAHQPSKIANRAYSNRMGNGPESSGDGWRYRGRGLIQLTGKSNYSWFAESIETPLDLIPEYLETFEGAVQSACWYWETNNLNNWIDINDFDGLSDMINKGHKTSKQGDAIGYSDRLSRFKKALRIL